MWTLATFWEGRGTVIQLSLFFYEAAYVGIYVDNGYILGGTVIQLSIK